MTVYKGVEINTTPTDTMVEEAQRGLDWREEFGRGGTEVGVARARDIINKKDLSAETVRRMISYFARHEVDKQGQGFSQGEEGYPSAGRIAWALWGGDAGKSWAEAKGRTMDRIDDEDRAFDERPYPNEHAARLEDPDKYDEFRREENAGGNGIDFIYGIKDDKAEIQAIRFDKNLYSVEDSKKWLDDNGFNPIMFEPASEEKMEELKTEVTEQVEEIRAEEVAESAPVEEVKAEEIVAEEVEIPAEAERKSQKLTTRADAMEAVVEDDRRVRMAISSEQPVERSFGIEVLDHSPESIDLSFLNSGRAPLLLDHDPEKQIGVIESVSLDGNSRKLRAVVRFGKGAQASEVYDDVADNIRGNVSIGYQIKKMARDTNDKSVYRATNWMPLEASIVSIPADVTVGVGRSAEPSNLEKPQVEAEQSRSEDTAKPLILEKKMENVEIKVEERAQQFDKPVQADIGMSKPEMKRYSLMRAINALANPTDRQAQRAAAFELECSEAAQRAFGQSAQGLLVPADILRTWAKRDLNTTDDAGFVGQDFRAGDFIDALRNSSSVMQAGATMLTGLQGNVKIPKKTAASSGGWITEGSASSESEMTVGSVTMTPKTVGAFTDISRQMMIQSTLDIEALVRQDLTDSLALSIDLGALAGSGSSGQPTGIKNTSGINNPTDFAAAIPTWAEVVAMETAVAEDNALRGNLAYILPASMYGALKTTAKDSGSGQFVVSPDGTINGYRAIVSNQVTSGDLYFGNFADLLIGLFGGLDIIVDPYTASSAGTVRVVALQSVDVAVRNAVSFAVNNDGV